MKERIRVAWSTTHAADTGALITEGLYVFGVVLLSRGDQHG